MYISYDSAASLDNLNDKNCHHEQIMEIKTHYSYVGTVKVKKGNVLLLHYKNTTVATLYMNYNAYYAKLQIVLQETTDRTT